MCNLKNIEIVFFISFSVGLIIKKLYLNEKRIYNLENCILMLENDINDINDIIYDITKNKSKYKNN